jgi:hypothetical protein
LCAFKRIHRRKIRLSEAKAWLLSEGLKFNTNSSLFEGRAGSGVFRRNLISRHLLLLERSPLSFRLRFKPFWLVPTTVWGKIWLVKRSAFALTVGPLYWRYVRKQCHQGWCFSAGTLHRDFKPYKPQELPILKRQCKHFKVK